MTVEDLFKFWDKLSSVQPDLILFVSFVFLVFKFKDVVDVYFRIRFKEADELKEAKKLLELSGYSNTRDMRIIDNNLRNAALALITDGVNARYREFCYYLMHVASEKDKYINTSIFKCLPFIETEGDDFIFNESAYTKWQVRSVIIALVVGFTVLFAGSFNFGDNHSSFKLAWLLNFSGVLFFAAFINFFLIKKPHSGDIAAVNDLLLNPSVKDFKKFKYFEQKILI